MVRSPIWYPQSSRTESYSTGRFQWYYDHSQRERNLKWKMTAAVNFFMLLLGLFLLGGGTWACAESIKESYASGDVGVRRFAFWRSFFVLGHLS